MSLRTISLSRKFFSKSSRGYDHGGVIQPLPICFEGGDLVSGLEYMTARNGFPRLIKPAKKLMLEN